MCAMALKAARIVQTDEGGRREVDLKRYCAVEKVRHGLNTCKLMFADCWRRGG